MDSVLRDINREQSKMQSDVDNLHRHYEKMAGFVRQYIEQTTVEWAKLVVSHPRTRLLILETTQVVDEHGYATHGNNIEPIRITIHSPNSTYDQLLHPTHSLGVVYTEHHGISWLDVQDKPRFAGVWPEVEKMLEDCHIVVFGQDYAHRALQSVTTSRALDNAFCLHNKCKEFYNEFYELSLQKILSYQGIDKNRIELQDSRDRIQMLAQVVRNLAAGMPKQAQEAEDSNDLDEHPF